MVQVVMESGRTNADTRLDPGKNDFNRVNRPVSCKCVCAVTRFDLNSGSALMLP